MTAYIAILAISYLIGFLIVRRLLLADQRDFVKKLRAKAVDPKLAKELVGDSERWVHTLGPAFLYGTILGGTLCGIVWALGWGRLFN